MRELTPEPGAERPEPPSTEPIGLGGIRLDVGRDHAWPAPPEPGEGWRGQAAKIRRILVPLDGSSLAESALPVAARIAAPEGGALFLLSVLPVGDRDVSRPLIEHRGRYLGDTAKLLSGKLPTAALDLRRGKPAAEILAAAADVDADLITIASHGRSALQRFLLGSVSRRLLQLTDRPVLLVRPHGQEAPPLLDRVLVAVDGSAFAERVLPLATGLARAHGSELLLLCVPEIPEADSYGALAEMVADLRQQAEAQAEHYLRGLIDALAEDGIRTRGRLGGSGAAQTIVGQAEELGAGLILMATHGRGGLDGMLLGSVASRVARHAKAPVLLLPIHERAPNGGSIS